MRQLPNKFLAAMIAVLPLPGSPMYDGDDKRVVEQALEDLEKYKKVSVDSVVLENDHDLPYIKSPLPEKAVQLMTKIAKEVRNQFQGPIGIQIMEGNNEQALKIALKTDLDFLRVEGFVFAHVGGAGIIEACAGTLLRKRKELGCDHIKIFADVKKKHCAHALTGDLDITDEVKQAEFFLVDGIIVTSKFTGKEPDKEDLRKVQEVTKLPIIIGSGMNPENIGDYFPLADGFIVGSTFRKEGKFLAKIGLVRLEKFMTKFHQLRENSET